MEFFTALGETGKSSAFTLSNNAPNVKEKGDMIFDSDKEIWKEEN